MPTDIDTEYMTPTQAADALAHTQLLPPLTGPQHADLRLTALERRLAWLEARIAQIAQIVQQVGWHIDD